MNSTISDIRQKDKAREEIKQKTLEFLARGKEVEICESGFSTDYIPGNEYYRTAKAT